MCVGEGRSTAVLVYGRAESCYVLSREGEGETMFSHCQSDVPGSAPLTHDLVHCTSPSLLATLFHPRLTITPLGSSAGSKLFPRAPSDGYY